MIGARATRAALVVLAALLVLAQHAAPAGAVASVAPAARGLAHGRLYVDPAVAETIDAGTRAKVARQLARRGDPIYVAIVPFAQGDAFDADGTRFLTALAGRAQRPGVYVTYDVGGILLTRGYRAARAAVDRADQAANVANLESRFGSPPGPRLETFLGALDDPGLSDRERRASDAFNRSVGTGGRVSTTPGSGAGGNGGGGGWGGLPVLIAAVAVVLAAGAVVLARRRRARPVDDRPVLPARVFSLAREASRDELAERADAMLIELSGLIDAAPPSAGTQRALDAYEAAERVLRAGEPDVPDLVGALVCIDLGRAALSDDGTLPPPCTYDPRHGPSHGRPVTVDATELRLCRSCRADVRAGRPADVLRDGAGRPYFDDAGPWAASGYGAWSDPVRAVLDRR